MNETYCPLCSNDKHMKKAKALYGKQVCRKCYYRFANRRQLAYIIDILIIRLIIGVIGAFVVVQLETATMTTASYTAFDVLLFVLPFALLLFKDGLAGCSPGKSMCGVQVVDDTTLVPIGFFAAWKRNLPVLIPIVPLIVAVQLSKGHRWGDGWANTRVIWKKFKDHPVFTGAALTDSTNEYLPGDVLVARPISDNPYASPMAPPE